MVLLEAITAVTFILGGNAYHFDRNVDNRSVNNRSVDWHEDNRIEGMELKMGDYSPFVKFFDNSYDQPSKAIGFNYQKCAGETFTVCGGYTANIIEGYVDREMNPFPYIAPQGSLGYGILGYGNFRLSVQCLKDLCVYEFKVTIELNKAQINNKIHSGDGIKSFYENNKLLENQRFSYPSF